MKKPTLLFVRNIEETAKPRYQEASLGFSWVFLFFTFLVPFVRDSKPKVGFKILLWYIVTYSIYALLMYNFVHSETWVFALEVSLGSARFHTSLVYLVTLCFVLSLAFLLYIPVTITLACFYNKWSIHSLFKDAWKPADRYTIQALQENLRYVPKQYIRELHILEPFEEKQ